MEIVGHPAVGWGGQVRHGGGAVVVVAAHQNQGVWGDGPDMADALAGNAVPGVDKALVRHFVQQLEGHMSAVAAETPGQLLPQAKKPLLVIFTVKKPSFLFPGVKGKARCFMQVQHRV